MHWTDSTKIPAIVQIGDETGVAVPDELLTTGRTLIAHVYLHTGEADGETVKTITIPVNARASVSEEQPTPAQESAISEAIEALNDGVETVQEIAEGIPETINTALEAAKASGEFDGADGYSPTVSVTDITGGHRVSVTDAQGTDTFDVMDGADGDPGDDGYSPTVTVTDITGGHRVTITDASGQHTFDVMDGQDGQGAVQDVQVAGTSVVTNGVANIPMASASALGAVKVHSGADRGLSITSGGYIGIAKATDNMVKAGTDEYSPIVPKNAKNATFYGLARAAGDLTQSASSNPVGTYTDDAKTAIKSMLGVSDPTVTDVQVNGVSVLTQGVANVPVSSGKTLGVVRCDRSVGTQVNGNGYITVVGATGNTVKAGTEAYKPIQPVSQHESTFYGLAKAAGSDMASSSNAVGQYTESAKSAISTMLTSPVSVSGTTPTITALPGIRYVCGEVSTLDITLPASGCIDAVFQSGSTPTVLTVTPPTGATVKWANGFDPTALEANTTYEINIADGLGVAVGWT